MSDERGFTIVELLMAVTIGLGVSAACLSLLTSAMKRSDDVNRRADAQLRARVAIDTAQRSLRAQACLPTATPQPPIVSATATAVTFYADLAGTGTPTRRTLAVGADGTFTESVWTNPSGSGTPTVRRLATGLTPAQFDGVPQPYFSYYAYSTATPPVPTVVLNPGASGLSAGDAAKVAKIDIRLGLAPRTGRPGGRAVPNTDVRDSVIVRLTDPDGSRVPQCI